MSRMHIQTLATAVAIGITVAGVALAQSPHPSGAPPFHVTGSGIADAEMDHSQMGGVEGPSSAPTFHVTGSGMADAEMDHRQMAASQNPRGGAPDFQVTGSGIADAEMNHSQMGGGQGTSRP